MVKVCNCSKSKFVEVLNNNQIIAVCAGNDFFKFYKEYNLSNQVRYVVDNNRKDDIVIDNYKIKIIAFSDIKKYVDKNTILVLTSLLYSDEILKQLDLIPEIEDINTYIPQIIEDEKIFNVLPLGTSKKLIPKKIHYCWFGGKDFPDEFKRYIDTWYQKCPDYEIIRWDEDNYDITKNQYMYEAYKCKKWGFVPDYARLDIIYEHGGFYLDTDVELLQSLDKLRYYDFVCGFESWEYIALGLGFGAVAHNKDIFEMMNMYKNMHFIQNNGEMNLMASPKYQTQYFVQQGLIQNGEMQVINGGLFLPTEYLCPIDMLGNGEPTSNSISVHHYAGTWLDEKNQNLKKRKINNRKMIISRIDP